MRCPVAFAALSFTFAAVAPTQQLLLSSSYGAPTSPTATAPSVPLVDGNHAWFTAATRDLGREIWVTDGTATGTHVAIPVEYPSSLLAAGQGHLVFSDGVHLWITDGTLPGTRALWPLRDSYVPIEVAGNVNGHAFISMDLGWSAHPKLQILSIDLRHGAIEDFSQLWQQLSVLHQEIDGLLFLEANHSNGTSEAWVTDGTIAGSHTLLTTDQRPVSATYNFAKFRDAVYFEGTHDHLPLALYRIKNGNVTADRLFVNGLNISTIDYLSPTSNGMVYLRGAQLWVTDGTSVGTRQLAVPGLAASELIDLGGRAVFSGYTAAHGWEPWLTDGTLAGTHELVDFAPGPGSSSPNYYQVAGDRMFFHVALNGMRTLQRTDGTAIGTITAAVISIDPHFLVPLGSGVLYADGPDTSGRNLWFADGDRPPRQLTQSFLGRAPIPVSTPWNQPRCGSVRGALIFPLREAAYGNQLWRSDGTLAGTQRLCDQFLGPNDGCLLGIPLGDRMLFYGATAAGEAAYLSDGTALGTVQTDVPREALGYVWEHSWIPLGDQALMVGFDIYHTDGTAVGTSRLPFPPYQFTDVMPTSDMVFATRDEFELWGSDGWVSGTRRIDDNVYKLVGTLGADVLYISYGYPQAPGLYASNGGPPRFLAAVPFVGQDWGLVWNNRFWFSIGEVWRTDGTAAGTEVLPYNITKPVPGPDALYYIGYDQAHGSELWRTDGTPAGTWRVTDLMPGPMDGVLEVSAVADRLFLTARDPAGGTEPWISDGTAAGTFRLADITPGPAPSDPVFLGVAGEYLYFYANEGERNVGLYSVRLGDLGIAQRERLGAGCIGSAGRPTLDCSAFPHVGDGAFHFDLQHAPALAPVFLLLGTEHGVTSLGPCVLRTAGDIAALGTNASFGGHAAWPQPIPALPSLIGVSLTAQAVIIDGGAQGPGFSVSDALLLVIGG